MRDAREQLVDRLLGARGGDTAHEDLHVRSGSREGVVSERACDVTAKQSRRRDYFAGSLLSAWIWIYLSVLVDVP